jgi:outer membrane protein with beta-barrel domain
MRLSRRKVVSSIFVLAACLPVTAAGQARRGLVFGNVGLASIGTSDSEQGKAPIFGGGAAFHLTPRLVVEGDLHGARVSHVFGRPDHDFSELTVTGSLLYRAFADRRVRLLAGGGVGLQRAHSAFNVPPVGAVDRTETIRLWHWRAGPEWDVSDRMIMRTEFVSWFGEGIDWAMGGRLSVGYRF